MGPAWVPVAVVVSVGVGAGLGGVVICVVNCFQVDDDPFLSAA